MNVQFPGKVLEPVACNEKIIKNIVVYKKHLPVIYILLPSSNHFKTTTPTKPYPTKALFG
jgi:hypothetical protein